MTFKSILLHMQDLRKFRSWSSHNKTSGKHFQNIRDLREILSIISGNDIASMLEDVLIESEKSLLTKKHEIMIIKLSLSYLNI